LWKNGSLFCNHVGDGLLWRSCIYLTAAFWVLFQVQHYFLIVLRVGWEKLPKLAAAAGGDPKAQKNFMLVRSSRMGYLSIRIYDGNYRMVQRNHSCLVTLMFYNIADTYQQEFGLVIYFSSKISKED
jgi:hypothetical protein